MDPRAALVAAAAASLLADQSSKLIVLSAPAVRSRAVRAAIRPLVASPPLAARWGAPRIALIAFWLGVALLALLGPAVGWFATRGAQMGLGLALGGAAGNLLDLARRGGVVDFIHLGIWPSFNLADVAIVVGVAVTLVAR